MNTFLLLFSSKRQNKCFFESVFSGGLFRLFVGFVIVLLTITTVSAQYTGGIGSGYAMAELTCFLEDPVITSNSPVCDNAALLLQSEPSFGDPYPPEATYAWTGPGGWTSDQANPQRDPAVAGQYYLIVSVPGCGDSNQILHEVITNPTPTVFNISGGGEFCAGGTGVTINLSGSQSGVTYELVLDGSPTGTTLAGTGAAIAFNNVTAAGNYTIIAENNTTNCENSMNGDATVTINPLPTVFNVSGGGEFCAGGTGVTINLSGSQSGVTYELVLDGSPTGTTLAGTGAAIAFNNVTVAGNYTIIAENNTTNCENTMNGNASVVVNPLPTAFDLSGDDEYCAGSPGVSLFLSGSEVGVNYRLHRNGFYLGIFLEGTGSALEFENVMGAGNYTVVARNTTTNCEELMNGSIDVTILPIPTVIVVAESSTEFCEGGEVAFQAIPEFPAYQWYENTLGEITGEDGATFIATESGEYYVVVTAENGCQRASAVQTVTVYDLPVVSIAPDGGTEFCDGLTLDLIASASGVGNISYKWYKDEVAIVGAEGPEYDVLGITETGVYFVEITDDFCSNISNEIEVTVFELPVVTLTPASPVNLCENDIIEVLIEATTGFDLYTWFKDGVEILGETQSSLLATEAGEYHVIVTDNNSCSSSSEIFEIIVNPLPVVDIIAAGDTEFCFGESVLFEATPGFDKYEWYWNGVFIEDHDEDTLLATEEGEYYVVVTDGFNCINTSNTIEIIVNPLPVVDIIADGFDLDSGSIVFCEGQTIEVLFEATAGFDSYQWFKDGVVIDEATEEFYLATETGQYYVVVSNEFNCFGNSEVITIIELPVPIVEITTDGVIELCSQVLEATPGFENYLWYIDGVEIEDENNSTLVARFSGEYVVWAIDENNCTGISDPIILNLPDRPIADAGNDQTIDYGTSTTLSAADGGTGNYSYSWEPAALLIDANVQNPVTVNLTETTVFTLMVIDLDSDCDNFDQVTVFVNPLPEVYTLTVSISPVDGGSVEVRVDGNLLSEPYEIEEGKLVELTAINATNYEFLHYVFDSGQIIVNPYSFVINEDTDVTAVFEFKNFIVDIVDSDVTLYPNPARNHINLVWENIGNNASVNIYNMQGQLITTLNYAGVDGNVNEKIDLSSWQKGLYYVRFSNEKGTTTKSFVVQ